MDKSPEERIFKILKRLQEIIKNPENV